MSKADYGLIELLLARLMRLLVVIFSDSEMSEVREYFDHGEYGLALETAVAIFDEEKKVASPEVEALVIELARAMSMDSADLVERFKHSEL